MFPELGDEAPGEPVDPHIMGWSAAGTLKLCRLRGRRHPMKLHVLGIDLGKTVFHLVGLDSTGKVVIRKKCSRTQLLAFTANLQVQLIGMESCSGSHFLGRALREQGHEVRLMPAQYVKPYVQTNKSDFLDADAIAEAQSCEDGRGRRRRLFLIAALITAPYRAVQQVPKKLRLWLVRARSPSRDFSIWPRS